MKSPLRYAFVVASAALLFPFTAARAQLAFDAPVNYSPGKIDLDTGLPAAPSDTTNVAPLNNPVSIAVGDFDGDSKLDLAVINGIPIKVGTEFKFYLSILFGNGDGTFADPQIREIGMAAPCPSTTKNLAVCDRGVFIVAGKFNGLISTETHDDLAIVYFGNPTASGSAPVVNSKVGIFLSNGTKIDTFGAAPSFHDVGLGAVSAAVGDFDNDDHLDIAVANRDNGGSDKDSISVLWGNGAGGFSAQTDVTVGQKPVALAVGDFDGDGHPDLAVVNSFDNDVTILLYDTAHLHSFKAAPNCTGATKTTCPVGQQPFGIAAGDFDGDHILDLAVFDQQTKTVTILLGNGDGTFTPSPKKKIALGKVAVQMIADDFNGDGTPDLAFAFFPKHNLSVFPGTGDGGFISPGLQLKSTGTNGTAKSKSLGNFAIASGRFNTDGEPDLAVANGDISVFLNNTPDPSGVSVTVTSPNGGETLTIGSTQAVTWNTILVPPDFPFGNVRIDLLTDAATGFKTIVKSAPNTGTFSLKVPSAPTTTGRIRVCSVNYPGICDESNADFTISP